MKKLPESAWEQMRQLFFQGLSIRQIAARTGTPIGTVAARCVRERWSAQRMQLAAIKQQSSPSDTEGMIRAIVLENKLKTQETESRSAMLLSRLGLQAIEDGLLPIKTLRDLELAQLYRERLWPSRVEPGMSVTFSTNDAAQGGRSVIEAAVARGENVTLHLHYAHEFEEVEGARREGRDPDLLDDPPPAAGPAETGDPPPAA